MQQNIVSLLDIDTEFNFDQYPYFVPEESFNTEDENYVLRELEKIDEEIVPPLTYIDSPNDLDLFEKYLVHLNYG